MKISVIVPCLNEEAAIEAALASCRPGAHEIIVVDGGSRDQTIVRASGHADMVLSTRPGRGCQQALGAKHATGDVLLFLHADTLLPPGYNKTIQSLLKKTDVAFGAFSLGADLPGRAMALICFGANLRTRVLGMPYGDQAIFVKADDYWQAGGFGAMPIMEDVDLVKKLSKVGKFKMARASVKSSARRWRQDGLLRRTLGNYSLILRHLAGATPEDLFQHYKNTR
ncbi:MAG: TIGR04283 family arsenosugar biosynthesis glycosyltransferase [Desulfatibacillum sp.]|nr:TIGR04283 family arsenosugar biosynthesis glycosyltransferase [Desulfatibacillum sp.]